MTTIQPDTPRTRPLPHTAAVIGGGIAGPVAALALHRIGMEATVYEAHPDPADHVGAMLTLAPNGVAALQSIDAEGVLDGIGQPITRTVMADGKGRVLAAFDGLHDLAPSRALWRSDLYRALRDHARAQGIRYEAGRQLVTVRSGAESASVTFADGGTIEADLVVGADGINSALRTFIDPSAGPADVPLINVGAVADITVNAEVGAAYFVFGRRAFLGYWIEPDGRTAWFANIPDQRVMTGGEARSIDNDTWLTRLGELFIDETPGRALVAATRPENVIPLGSIQIMPNLTRWHRDRAVLVGDSVHAPSPSSGQGASLAIESAVELARCLRDHNGLAAGFAAYEAMRRPRVEAVAKRAMRTNNTKTFGPVATRLMGVAMPIALRTVLTPEKMLGIEQRYRINFDAPVGV